MAVAREVRGRGGPAVMPKASREGDCWLGRTVLSSIVDRMTGFLKEVRIESTKVTWPSRKELRESTIVVVIAVFFIAVFIGAADRVLTFLLHFVL